MTKDFCDKCHRELSVDKKTGKSKVGNREYDLCEICEHETYKFLTFKED
jgi:hypothetical protein